MEEKQKELLKQSLKAKSDIAGNGYGSKHIWNNCGTVQHNEQLKRHTVYWCPCGAFFEHYYQIIDDIFEAMEEKKIKEECKYRNLLIEIGAIEE